jgi:hypothetical protein
VHASLGSDVPGDDLARRDPYAGLQTNTGHRWNLETHDSGLHGERCAHRARRVVGVHDRRAEEREDAVSEQVGNRATLVLDSVAHDGQVAVEKVEGRLRRLFRDQGGVAPDVGEERGGVTTVSTQRDGVGVAQRLCSHALADVLAQQIGEAILERLGAKQRTDPRHELDLVEWLRQEVIGTDLQPASPIVRAIERREHEDRQASVSRLAPQSLAHLDAVDARHHHVQADEVGLVLLDGGERGGAILGLDQVIAVVTEQLVQECAIGGLVVRDQDERARPHRSSASTLCANVANSIGLLR